MSFANNTDKLIYNLIFSQEKYFKIDIANYIEDIYMYENFVDELKKVLKKSQVKVINSKIIVDSKTVTWELKVDK
jgi:hypothetical protein